MYFLPTKLEKGYLLDNRGISINTAFLNITYKDYSELKELPSIEEFHNLILDNNPFFEIYQCEKKYNYKNIVEELNQII